MFQHKHAFSSFSVNDLAKAKEFYGKTLGLQVKDIPEGLDITASGGDKIFAYHKDNHTPATFTVLNFVVDSVEQAVEELTKAGVKFEIYNDGPLKTDEKGIARGDMGPTIAWFKDPAGNFLSVMEGNMI